MLKTLFDNSFTCYERAQQWHKLALCHVGADWKRRQRCEMRRDKWINKMILKANQNKG